mgnify:CR=1 FL=1
MLLQIIWMVVMTIPTFMRRFGLLGSRPRLMGWLTCDKLWKVAELEKDNICERDAMLVLTMI